MVHRWMLNVLKRKSLNVLGLAETFLQQEGEVDVPGYVSTAGRRG